MCSEKVHSLFNRLRDEKNLAELDAEFLSELRTQDPELAAAVLAWRQDPDQCDKRRYSRFLVLIAPILQAFLVRLFGIESEAEALEQAATDRRPIFAFKAWYVHKHARRRQRQPEALRPFETLDTWLRQHCYAATGQTVLTEVAVATLGMQWQADEAQNSAQIERLIEWCVHGLMTPTAQHQVASWLSFQQPEKIDHADLVPLTSGPADSQQAPTAQQRCRDGFGLTDTGMSPAQIHAEVDYCVYCHRNDGDFCSTGFPVKKNAPKFGFKLNPLGNLLVGCPLDEKISEMHMLEREGLSVAALAVMMVDNPLCAMTGHRICNDCMKACIYQKQTPVNIPQAETGILKAVLALPWGVELYDLLMRWNPLKKTHWLAQPYNGQRVFVMGMGPAGITLAHYLTQAGYAVVGADGLKIEPLDVQLLQAPIRDYHALEGGLDTRVIMGFGGVLEYGITARWDKRFLKLLYICLARRSLFQVFGGVRFGGTLTVEEVWALGFDHLALAVGAGLPKALSIPNSLAPGMRQANDFLMTLQLTGAAKADSLAVLQLRLPVLVIGGGLTAIDTATEAQAYYVVQVEKLLSRYEALLQRVTLPWLSAQFDAVSWTILQEAVQHGQAIRQARARALAANQPFAALPLLRAWGGVTLVYRGAFHASPAYLSNHEEVAKALEEGILYREGLVPQAVTLDEAGQVSGLTCRVRQQDDTGVWCETESNVHMAARSILVATGSKPNVAYGFEHADTFQRKRFEYLRFNDAATQLVPVDPEVEVHVKSPQFGPFTSYQDKAQHRVSVLGDTHPVFHGSVVKAIASAKRCFPEITAHLAARSVMSRSSGDLQTFMTQLRQRFVPRIVAVQMIAKGVVAWIIYAPQHIAHFRPGQFYRLQNFESLAPRLGETILHIEALALVGYRVERELGHLHLVSAGQPMAAAVLSYLKQGDPVSLMGPTGVRTRMPETAGLIMLIAEPRFLVTVLSLAEALHAAGQTITLLLQVTEADTLFWWDRVQAVCQHIVWQGGLRKTCPLRPGQDCSVAAGELTEALSAWHQLNDAGRLPQRVHTLGQAELLRCVQAARQAYPDILPETAEYLGHVSGPMQCMLKGVCAQCLQWQIDPETGERTKAVYACSWQNQPMALIDIDHLASRDQLDRAHLKLRDLWLQQTLSEAHSTASTSQHK